MEELDWEPTLELKNFPGKDISILEEGLGSSPPPSVGSAICSLSVALETLCYRGMEPRRRGEVEAVLSAFFPQDTTAQGRGSWNLNSPPPPLSISPSSPLLPPAVQGRPQSDYAPERESARTLSHRALPDPRIPGEWARA